MKKKNKNLVILDLNKKEKKIIENCLFYKIANNGDDIIVVTQENELNCLYKFAFSKKKTLIWKGKDRIENAIIDPKGDQIAFCINSALFLYNIHNEKKITPLEIANKKEFSGLLNPILDHFSLNGKLLLFSMIQPVPFAVPSTSQVSISSYLDGIFTLNPSDSPSYYTCLYNTFTQKSKRIEHENERIKTISEDEKEIFIESAEGPDAQSYWSRKSQHRDYVLFIDTEDTVTIQTTYINNNMFPSGNFVIGSNNHWDNIYCTDVNKKVIHDLTSKLPFPSNTDLLEKFETEKSSGLSLAAFITPDSAVIISDQYDLWLLNSRNDAMPINLTNGIGRKQHIRFQLIPDNMRFKKNEGVVISAYNEENKQSGFYKIKLGTNKAPELLTMDNYTYFDIKKARDANIWVLKRMSATDAPNYFWTSDFKTFQPLSNIHPEKKYNWYTVELIKYTSKSGESYDAMLYKPGNFDSTKKYPVLFNFYEKESFKFNSFLLPGYTSVFYFNIPLMLNRGYLVCVPDINFKLGETANSIVNSVESAADYLSHLPYIDSAHFGASGGSFGGYGTNCLAALSHKFKALVSVSGLSDLVSAYGNIPGLREEIFENGPFRLGVSLAKDPELYLRNSPITYTKNVTTPLLIAINSIDGNVNIQQGIEFFISLRRSGKKVRLLQYLTDGISHGINNENDQRDFYGRMNQFFDYYLKGSPIPKWMTQGSSMKKNSMRLSAEYDSVNQNPPIGLPIDSI